MPSRCATFGVPVLPPRKAASLIAAMAAMGVLAGCAGVDTSPSSRLAANACAQLATPINASAIALPSRGAVIDSARLVEKSSEMATSTVPPASPVPEAGIVPATPQYCLVLGHIEPLDATAPPIRFEVNLPTEWSGRSLQYGGGGFNGVLVSGLALPPSARIDRAAPLARGFATYGTDSGHANAAGVAPQAFALNDEALENFAHASYKKVRDAAVELMKRRYGRGPGKLYFMGSAEGGREALAMAQRYPGDFDGIFARVPVIGWTGLQAAGTRMGATQMGEGWISPERVRVLSDAVLAQCDLLDGLADGVVSNYEGCLHVFDPRALRCAEGAPSGSCLNQAQIDAVRVLHAPFEFGFDLANGLRSYPGWGYGGEAANGTGLAGGYVAWQTGVARQALPAGTASSRAWLYGSGAIQYFYMHDANADPLDFIPAAHIVQVRRVSALMDATDPDLSAFRSRGGKLVISEHMADYAQSPYAGIAYYRSVVTRMGQALADSFLRLYVTPGADHVGMGAPTGVDMLEVLVNWVEQNVAPADLIQVSSASAAPHQEITSRPMCRYPTYPRYVAGSIASASSFACVRRSS